MAVVIDKEIHPSVERCALAFGDFANAISLAHQAFEALIVQKRDRELMWFGVEAPVPEIMNLINRFNELQKRQIDAHRAKMERGM